MNKSLAVLKEIFRSPLSASVITSDQEGEETRAGVRKSGAEATGSGGAGIVSRNFKLVFLSVLFISIATLAAQFWMVNTFGDDMGTARAKLVEYLQTIATAGTGAVFGLIGGKTA